MKATEEKLDELRMEIREKDANIEILESKIAILENNLNLLTTECDNNEQYTRRGSLRINNIPLAGNGKESADQCMHKVKDVIAEAGINMRFWTEHIELGNPKPVMMVPLNSKSL